MAIHSLAREALGVLLVRLAEAREQRLLQREDERRRLRRREALARARGRQRRQHLPERRPRRTPRCRRLHPAARPRSAAARTSAPALPARPCRSRRSVRPWSARPSSRRGGAPRVGAGWRQVQCLAQPWHVPRGDCEVVRGEADGAADTAIRPGTARLASLRLAHGPRRSASAPRWEVFSRPPSTRRLDRPTAVSYLERGPTRRARSMPDTDTVHLGSGKVRELYALGDDRLLLVASDRISTFDVVLPTEIPDKGRVLTGLAAFWFARTRSICPNHLLALRPDGRSTECRRLTMLPIECVVRGYLAGSGWKDYRRHGRGLRAPAPRRARRVRPAARADLHPGHQGAVRPRREHHARGRRAPRGRRDASPTPSASRSRSTASPRGTRSTAASSSPTRSSSSAPTRTGGSSWATRPSRPTRRGSGRPTSTCPAVRSRPSTSSSCAISASRRAGTRPIRAPRCPPTSSRGRGRATSRPSSASPGSASPTTSRHPDVVLSGSSEASGAGRP